YSKPFSGLFIFNKAVQRKIFFIFTHCFLTSVKIKIVLPVKILSGCSLVMSLVVGLVAHLSIAGM
ncbi:hypothetical protein, partial [Salmonella enterica]|uniref:hypothetical protein n=1 Tax=Salmonella enterica TaxID=28901 RepID=UPI00345684CE